MGCRFSDKVRKTSAPGCGSLLVKGFHGKRILDSKSEAIQTETSGPASEKVCSWDRNRMKQEHFHRSTYVARSSWHLMVFHVRDTLTRVLKHCRSLPERIAPLSSRVVPYVSSGAWQMFHNYLLEGLNCTFGRVVRFFFEILRSCSARASAEASTFTPNHD